MSNYHKIDPRAGFTDVIDLKRTYLTKKPTVAHNLFFTAETYYEYLQIDKIILARSPNPTPNQISIKFDV